MLEKRKIVKKIADFIGKDISSSNESKKLMVVIRVLIISIILYFIIDLFLCREAVKLGGVFFFVTFIISFAGIFTLSYRSSTKPVLWIFIIGMLVWVWAIAHYFGWNIGVQHFLMVLLVLNFFSGYKQYKWKILFAVVLCVFRILLFYSYQNREPVWQLAAATETFCQSINTVTIFWCISVISYIFSKDSQELEGKLVDYNNFLKQQADTDILTGLPNRRKAEEFLKTIYQDINNDTGSSLCICDIDFFKKVNDKYGHDVGDEVIKEIAGIFKEEIKEGEFAARWGGEEFLLLFPKCNGDDAYIKLESIRRKIKDFKFHKDTTQFGVTMTFGLAEYDYKNNVKATIIEADQKLYMGKNEGRDRIVF